MKAKGEGGGKGLTSSCRAPSSLSSSTSKVVAMASCCALIFVASSLVRCTHAATSDSCAALAAAASDSSCWHAACIFWEVRATCAEQRGPG